MRKFLLPLAGVIKELLVDEGETLPVGAVVCTIEIRIIMNCQHHHNRKNQTSAAAILNAGVHKPLPKIDDTMQKRELREPKAKARYSPAVLSLQQNII